MTKNRIAMGTASMVAMLVMLSPAPLARADIFQWEYINPANPGLGKQQSATLAPDGLGANAARGANLSNLDLTKAYLTGTDVSALTVVEQGQILYTINSNLADVNLGQADLTNARFGTANIAGASFAGADIRGAAFSQHFFYSGSGLTLAQLYSTASYFAHDLRGVSLGGDYAGANFAGQNLANASIDANLTNANFSQANLRDADVHGALTGANLSGAEVRGADFTRYGYPLGGLTLAQLYSTASYQARDLSGVDLSFNDLIGGDFAGQRFVGAGLMGSALAHADFSLADLSGVEFTSYYGHPEFPEFYAADLTSANLSHANLANAIIWSVPGTNTGVNLTGSDARGAVGLDPIPAMALVDNFIRPDGRLAGLNLTAGASLVVRDYDGNPAAYPAPTGQLPIVVDDHVSMDASGALRLVFDADPWDSTISFAPGIPVTLGGTLELTFATGVDVAAQVGRTIDLFDWTGVTPTGAFSVSSLYSWDLSRLYTTGEVTLTAVGGTVPGDFNGDSAVDSNDLTVWRSAFGTTGGADADNDGDSDGADFLAWQRQLGSELPSATSSAAVPEPSTWGMLPVLFATFRRCRKGGVARL